MASENVNPKFYKRIKHAVSFEHYRNAVVFDCRLDADGEAFVRIDVLAPDMIRIRASLDNNFPESLPEKDGFLKAEWPTQRFRVKEGENGEIEIEADKIVVTIAKEPFKLSFYDEHRNLFLREHDDCGILWEEETVSETMSSPSDELLYGFADQGRGIAGFASGLPTDRAPLNHRGSRIRLENLTNMWGHGLPFFLSSKGYGLYLNTTSASTFDMALTNPDRYGFKVDIPKLDYYLIYGSSFKDILARYTELTGRSPLIPKWSMAPMVYGVNPNEAYLRAYGLTPGAGGPDPGDGRGPKTWYFQKQIEDQVRTIRAQHDLCGSIALDVWAWTGMCSFIWTPEIPEPEKMIETMIKNHIRFVAWQRPRLVAYSLSDGSYEGQRMYAGETYEEAERRGYFVKRPDGSTLNNDQIIAYGPAALVDFSNAEAVKWWKELQGRITRMGAEEWWLDSGSSGLGEYFPEAMDARFHNGMSGREMNCYNTPLYCKTVFEGLKEELKGKRALVDCRCVTPISPQRFPLQSLGDRTHRSTLAIQVRCAINYGLTGVAFWYGGIFGLFGPPLPAGTQMRFNPYTYAYWALASRKGVPVMRAMVLEYQDDPNTRLIDDQYMFGRELLIAPMLEEGQTNRPVYFPRGEWVNYWTGERYIGPRTVNCPAIGPDVSVVSYNARKTKVPIFVKAGSIIPLAPPMEWADQKPWDPLTLDIYLPEGGGKAEFTLYDDDGETYAYEKGEYAETNFEAEEKNGRVTVRIGAAEGKYGGKLKRAYLVRLNHTTCPIIVKMNDEMLPQCRSLEELEARASGWFYDRSKAWVFGDGWRVGMEGVSLRVAWCKTGPLGTSSETIVTLEGTRTVGFFRS